MKCETAIDLVVDSLVDDLEANDLRELETHFAACATCGAVAAEVRDLWRGLGELEAPAPMNADILVQFGRKLERRRRHWPTALQAVAAVALLLSGALLGQIGRGDGATPGPGVAPAGSQEYLLLVRGDEPDRRFPDAQLTSEYRAWAGDLASDGILIAAEKLADDGGRWVSDLTPPGENPATSAVRGYFLISAGSYSDAVEIARRSPHVSYGGIMEVRAIDQ